MRSYSSELTLDQLLSVGMTAIIGAGNAALSWGVGRAC